MHQTIFTSSHVGLEDVHRVHWLRYAIDEINDHRSHGKIRKRSNRFRFSIEDFSYVRGDHSELHQRYYDSINFDGAMSIEECLFGEEGGRTNIYHTKAVSVFEGDKLIAGGYFDTGEVSASSILHFYDPAYKEYSLGKLLILLTIDYLRLHEFTYYYPGYVVEGNRKMNYKLFLGKESAQYFDPQSVSWKYFNESILG
jgi:leucyl-tRNA---protein transferase